MKRGLFGLFVAIALALSCAVPAAFASSAPWDGAGTQDDPYLIKEAKDLVKLSDITNAKTDSDELKYRKSCFALANDIDLGSVAFKPIGTSGASFCGMFDGRGHVISGLNVNATGSGIGLFGYVGDLGNEKFLEDPDTTEQAETYSAVIKNFTLKGTVKGEVQYTGGVVGRAMYSVAVDSVTCEASVSGGTEVGGIVGSSLPTGNTARLVVRNCTQAGAVSATWHSVGGIVGSFTSQSSDTTSRIEGCVTTGDVSSAGSAESVGGIVGMVSPNDNYKGIDVLNCYCSGNVTRSGGEGFGVVGQVFGDGSHTVTVTNCYSVNTPYNSGDASKARFTDVEQRTAEQMKSADFLKLVKAGKVPDPLPDPVDTVPDNTVISDLAGWNAFVSNVNENGYSYKGKTVTLAADLNVGNATVGGKSDIGYWAGKYFMGTFDGQGHKITVNVANGSSWSGLFSFVSGSQSGGDGSFATVKNLVVNGAVSATEAAQFVGGVAGGAGRAYFQDVTSNVTVNSNCLVPAGHVGGIVGWASSYAKFQNCKVTGSVTGTSDSGRVGGIAGSLVYQDAQNPTLSGCEVSGAVTGGTSVGGLIGRSGAVDTALATVGYKLSLVNCKVTGAVSGASKVGSLVGEIAKVDVGNVELSTTGTTAESTTLPEVGSFVKNDTGSDTGTGTGGSTGSDKGSGTNPGSDTKPADPVASDQVTVTFDSDGGSSVESVTVEKGKAVAKPKADPIKSGYKFVEWQLGGKAYDFALPVSESITLKAAWEAEAQSPDTPAEPEPGTPEDSEPGKPDDSAVPAGASIEGATITVGKLVYTGSPLVPAVKVSLGKALTEGIDYVLSYRNSSGKAISSSAVKSAGSYVVVVIGLGKYNGSVTKGFTVAKATQALKASKATVKLGSKALKKKAQKLDAAKLGKVKGAKTAVRFAGKANKAAKKFSINAKTGKITVKKGLAAGTYKYTVTVQAKGNGNYQGSAAKKFVITLKVK